MKRATWTRPLALVLALALTTAACGGDDKDDASGGSKNPGSPAAAPGFDGTTINVAALSPDSGTVSVIGKPLTAGNQAYFDYINAQGGIAGKYKINLIKEDTAYNPSIAATKYAAVKDNVALIAQLLGTPVVDALLGDLDRDDIIALPASLDSKWVREKQLMPIGAPYQLQAINSIDWYFSQAANKDKKLCSLASTDAYGDAGMEGVDYITDKLGIELAAKATFPAPGPDRPAQNFQSQIATLKGGGCDVVFFIATASDTSALATALTESADFQPTIIGQSPTWLGAFAASPYLQQHFLLASEGTEYGDTSVPGMAQLETVRSTYSQQAPDIYFNFGYLQGIATVKLLTKAVELGDLSRAGLATALEELGTVSFDGLSGDYVYGAPADRVPPVTSSIFKPNATKPGGLEIVQRSYTAASAKDFEIT